MAEPNPRGTSPVKWRPATLLPQVAASDMPPAPVYARFMPKLGDFPLHNLRQLNWMPVVAIYCWLCHVLFRIKPTPDARPRYGEGVQHWVR
jgi:hypothetical protein